MGTPVDAHACLCAYVCVCICVYVYICVYFFCSECCVHFGTGVLGTSACADVYVIQVFVGHQRTRLRDTRCRMCTYVYVHIYMYAHTYVYGYVCASMILLEALRRCWLDCLSVYRCAYTCICICVYIYACMCACAHVCICMYVCLLYVCIYMYIHTRVGVHLHSCRRILFICTVQSLYYMRVYHRCLFHACMCV